MKRDAQAHYVFGGIFVLANRLQTLADSLDDKVTIKQWTLMAFLADNGAYLSVSELAHWTGSTRQNVRKMAALLQERGYVELQADLHDKRAVNISLTRKGKSYVTRRAKTNELFLQQLFSSFGETELSALCSGIKLLGDAVDKMEERN